MQRHKSSFVLRRIGPVQVFINQRKENSEITYRGSHSFVLRQIGLQMQPMQVFINQRKESSGITTEAHTPWIVRDWLPCSPVQYFVHQDSFEIKEAYASKNGRYNLEFRILSNHIDNCK